MKNLTTLEMYVVYKRPKDYPRHYVLRRWVIAAGKSEPTDWFKVADSLAAVREHIPWGFVRLERDPRDEPQIVECWI